MSSSWQRTNGTRALLAAMLLSPVFAQAPPPEPPARFERVLWCGDLARGAGLAAKGGYTAVQIGRGVDPAPAVEHGLGYYLDQPIGKGLLELRDEQWQPLAAAYQKTRDVAALIRPGCFNVPGAVDGAAEAAATEAVRVRGDGLRFVALADEASATRHDAPLDTCRCEHCLAAFRTFLARRWPSIGAVNEALGTQYTAFADVEPVSTDAVRRRELGDAQLPADLRAYSLWLEFVDTQWAAAVQRVAAAVQAAVPGVPVGLTGLSVPAAFGGNDPARLLPGLTLLEPYAIGGAPELTRCLASPQAHRYATLAPPAAEALAGVSLPSFVQAQVAAMACEGLAGVVVWNDGTIADKTGAGTPFGNAVQAALRRFAPALDACAGASIEPADVWVLESHASVRAWWMLDSAGDGMTWVRRLASHEREHSTSQAARLGWIRVLQDLGLQPRFVGEQALAERLLRERPRCLVLPATIAMADRTAQAIAAFVQGGGTVLADHGTGIYDETLRRRGAGGHDALFGIVERSLRWEDLLVREGRTTSRERGLPCAERGLRGNLAERGDGGDRHVEHAAGRGRAVYLNAPVAGYARWRLDPAQVEPARELRRRVRAVLQRAGVEPPCEVRGEGLPTCIERTVLRRRDGSTVLAIRVNALEAPIVMQRLAANGPRPVQIEFPVARSLRPVGGDDLGSGTRFELPLDAFGALFLEVAR